MPSTGHGRVREVAKKMTRSSAAINSKPAAVTSRQARRGKAAGEDATFWSEADSEEEERETERDMDQEEGEIHARGLVARDSR